MARNRSGYSGTEKPADRNLRELVQAALWARDQPCLRSGRNRACPCGPCSARRVVRRLRLDLTRQRVEAFAKHWNDSL